ncbi:MAG: cytochrome c3 family protein, partial [Gemmatimonadaceae bacterium]|nr:cytochrome c3 family protein [Gemmatimonadaceae bacterium]
MNNTRPSFTARPRARHVATLLTLAIAGMTSVGWAWSVTTRADERRFPHQAHARLFPVCETCHEGIATTDSASHFPPASSCAQCHDGTRLKRTRWDGPGVRPSNLVFSHGAHQQQTSRESPTPTCATCHGVGDTTMFMAVQRATPESCQQCHAHRGVEHLARENACSRCHAPLTLATRLSDSSVAALPIPAWHRAPDMRSTHAPQEAGDALQCSTCHARESCARCHPNAAEVSRAAALGTDPRVARALRGLTPEYFIPPSHARSDWASAHGDSAKRNAASCASCHARPGCLTCHIGRGAARQIGRLSRPDRDGAPGVRLRIIPLDA